MTGEVYQIRYDYGVDRQNELVRALRKQLEATERELANQKWVFQRYLESPSWRMTAPIRWAAKLLRNLASPSGRGEGHKPDATLRPSPGPSGRPLPEGEGS